MNKIEKIVFWMLFVLTLCGCNGNTETNFYTGPQVDIRGVTVAEIYVNLDTNGEFKITGDLPIVNAVAQLVGIDDMDASFEYTVIEAKQQTYKLYILWKNEDNRVVRNEYSFDKPFDVTFDQEDWVSRIAKVDNNIVAFVERRGNSVAEQPATNNMLARISSDVEEASIRKSPGYSSKDDTTDVIVHAPSSALVEIVSGPELRDDLNWWYVRWNGYEGWIAEKTGSGRTILNFNP